MEKLAVEGSLEGRKRLRGQRIAPGASSGLSIEISGVRARSNEGNEREGRRCSPRTDYGLLGFQRFSF